VARAVPPVDEGSIGRVQVGLPVLEVEAHEARRIPVQLHPDHEVHARSEREHTPHCNTQVSSGLRDF
jgi:hypothetical protein